MVSRDWEIREAVAAGDLNRAIDLADAARRAGVTHTDAGVPFSFVKEDLLRRRTESAKRQIQDLLTRASQAEAQGNLNRVHAYYARALNIPHADIETRRYILARIELLETTQVLHDQPGQSDGGEKDLDALLAHLLETIRTQKPNLFTLLRLCAVPLWLDEGVLAVLRGREDGTEAATLGRLSRYSFFYRWTDRYTLSRDARRTLLAEWREDSEGFLAVNRDLLAHFTNRLAVDPPRNPVDYERLVQSQLYHAMLVDVQAGTKLLGRLFQQAQDNHHLSAARQYVLVCKELEPLLDPAAYAYVTYFEARYHQLSGNQDAAFVLFSQLSRRTDLGPDLRARVLRGLGTTLVSDKRWVEGIEHFEAALALFTNQDNGREMAYTMNALGDAYLDLAITTRGPGDNFDPLARRHPLLSRFVGFGQLLARLPLVVYLIYALDLPLRSLRLRYLGLGMDWAIARLFTDAILWFRRARAIWVAQGDAVGQSRVDEDLARLYLQINHPHEAWHGFQALLDGTESGQADLGTYRTARSQLSQAEAALRLGDFDGARQLLDSALPVFTALRYHQRIAQTQERLGHLAVVAGEWPAAMQAYTAALGAWEAADDHEEATTVLHRMEALAAAHPDLPAEAVHVVSSAQDRVTARTYSIRYGHPAMQIFKRVAVVAFIVVGMMVIMLGLRTESGSQIGADTALNLPLQVEKEGGFGPDVEYTLEQQIVPQADSNLTRNAPNLVGQTLFVYFLLYTLAGLYVIRTLSLGQIQAHQRRRIVLDDDGISLLEVDGPRQAIVWTEVVSLLRADRKLWRILLDSFSATAILAPDQAVVIPGYTNHYQALMQWVHGYLEKRAPQPQDEIRSGPRWWRRLLSAATVDERVGRVPVFSAGFTVVRSKVGWVFMLSSLGLMAFVGVVLFTPDRLLMPLFGLPYALVDVYALLYLGIGLPLVYWFVLQMAMWEMLLHPNGRVIWLLMGGGAAVTVLALTQAVILQLPLSRPDLVWASAAMLILIFTLRALWTPRPTSGDRQVSGGRLPNFAALVYTVWMRLILTGVALLLLGLAGYAAGRELVSYANLVEGNRLLAQAESLRREDPAQAITLYAQASAAYDASAQIWESPNLYNSLGAIYVQLGKFAIDDVPMTEPVFLCHKTLLDGQDRELTDYRSGVQAADLPAYDYECFEETGITPDEFFHAAVDSYEAAWKIRPSELTYLLNVALTYQEWATSLDDLAESEARYSQALAIYDSLIERVQENPRTHGDFELRVREYRGAANYNMASELFPRLDQRDRAYPYFAAAGDDYRWIIQRSDDPKNRAVGYAGLGWIEFYQRYQLPQSDLDGRERYLMAARDAFTAGIDAFSGYAPLFNGLGWVEYYAVRDRPTRCDSSQPGDAEREHYIQGMQASIAAFNRGVRVDPGNGTYFRTLAQLNYILAFCNPEYDRIDQLEVALDNYASALAIRPLAVWYYRQGTISLALGDTLKAADRADEAQERYEVALESLLKAVAANPQEVEHWHWLYIVYGRNYLNLDRSTLADDILQAAQMDVTYENLVEMGELAIFRAEREYLGRLLLEKALALNPAGTTALRLLGQERFNKGEFQAALDYAQQAVDAEPIDADALFLLGQSHLGLGHLDEGVAALETAAVLAPLNYDIQLALGRAAYQAAQDEAAISAFTRAISLEPDDPQPRFYQGLVHVAQGDADGAALAYRLAVSVANGLSNSAKRKAVYNKAITDLLAVREDPADLAASMVDGVVAGLAQPIVDAGGDMGAFYAEQGADALSTGNSAFAVRLLERARELDPLNSALLVQLGQAYLARQEVDAALDAFAAAVQQAPDNSEARGLYGWTAYGLGQLDLAQAQMAEAVALDGDNAKYRLDLGVILAAQGEMGGAAASLAAGADLANRSPNRGALDGLYAGTVPNLRRLATAENQADITALLDQVSEAYTFAQVYDRDDFRTYWLVGWYLYEQRIYELSAAMSARAVVLNPDEPRVYFNQGLAQLAAGQAERAKITYAAGIETAALFSDGVARLNEALGDLRANRDDPAGIAPDIVALLQDALAGD